MSLVHEWTVETGTPRRFAIRFSGSPSTRRERTSARSSGRRQPIGNRTYVRTRSGRQVGAVLGAASRLCARGPVVQWLGHQVFNLGTRVQFPPGLLDQRPPAAAHLPRDRPGARQVAGRVGVDTVAADPAAVVRHHRDPVDDAQVVVLRGEPIQDAIEAGVGCAATAGLTMWARRGNRACRPPRGPWPPSARSSRRRGDRRWCRDSRPRRAAGATPPCQLLRPVHRVLRDARRRPHPPAAQVPTEVRLGPYRQRIPDHEDALAHGPVRRRAGDGHDHHRRASDPSPDPTPHRTAHPRGRMPHRPFRPLD